MIERALLAAMLCFGCIAPAAAQTFTVQSIGAADLGSIAAAASGQTVFRASAATGAVSKVSGNGGRVSGATVRALVTVKCGNQGACNSQGAQINIATTGTPTGRALALQNFTVSTSGATATITQQPGNGAPITFRIAPIGKNGTKTFWLGFDLAIKGDNQSGKTGNASAGFVVTISKTNGGGASSRNGTVTSKVFRALAISAIGTLNFGRISLPYTGTGTVSMAPGTAAVTVTGAGVKALGAGTYSVPTFFIVGEGGQSVSISVPAFTLSGTAGSITITPIPSVAGAQVLTGRLGSAGARSLSVGGSFNLGPSVHPGGYSGAVSVTVQYN